MSSGRRRSGSSVRPRPKRQEPRHSPQGSVPGGSPERARWHELHPNGLLAAALIVHLACRLPPCQGAGGRPGQTNTNSRAKRSRRPRAATTSDRAAGQYFDCAIVKQDNLTIEGVGPDAMLTDKTCARQGAAGDRRQHVTVRNLTLQRARVPDHNGAGIRAEGWILPSRVRASSTMRTAFSRPTIRRRRFRVPAAALSATAAARILCAWPFISAAVELLHVDIRGSSTPMMATTSNLAPAHRSHGLRY